MPDGVTIVMRLNNWFRKAARGVKKTDESSSANENSAWTPVLRFGVASTVGKYREHNEDSYYVPGWPPVQRIDAGFDSNGGSNAVTVELIPIHGPSNLVVVADGMGGQQSGEVASQMAIELVPKYLQELLALEQSNDNPEKLKTIIEQVLNRTNQDIISKGSNVRSASRMGSTVVLTYFVGKRVYLANMGDSRAYLHRGGKLTQLTRDHTMAHALFEAGAITKDELSHHKFRNMLYLHLGSADADQLSREIQDYPLRRGDRFVLATDGLTGVVTDAQIVEILDSHIGDPRKAAAKLVTRSIEQDSRDNVTCAVIDVD